MVHPRTIDALVDHIGPARFATYQGFAGGRDYDALQLYRWNLEMSGALHQALSLAEVALRNALDRELQKWNAAQPPRTTTVKGTTTTTVYATNWVEAPAGPLWAIMNPKRRNSSGHYSTYHDALSRAQRSLQARPPGHRRHGVPIGHDDLVAHMTFGTWKKVLPIKDLSHASGIGPHAQRQLWTQGVLNAFPHRQHPTVIAYWVDRLHALRNRVAHLEPLCDVDVMSYHRTIAHLLRAIDPSASEWYGGISQVPDIWRARPY